MAVYAAVPIELPVGEPEDVWAEVLELAGLERGEPRPGGPFVTVRVEGAEWILEVRDASGERRSTAVDAPRTAAEREAVAFVAKSLLTPVEASPLVVPIELEPEVRTPIDTDASIREVAGPARPRPVPRPVPAQTREPAPEPPAEPSAYEPPPAVLVQADPAPVPVPKPQPVTRPAPLPVPAPRPAREPARVWFELDGGLAVRPTTGPSGRGALAFGFSAGRWDLGVRGVRSTRERFGALGPDRGMAETGLAVKVARFLGPWRVGGVVGAANRAFREADVVLQRAWVPELQVELGRPFGRIGVLEPFLAVGTDLVLVDLRVNGEVVQSVFPVTFGGGIRVALRSGE